MHIYIYIYTYTYICIQETAEACGAGSARDRRPAESAAREQIGGPNLIHAYPSRLVKGLGRLVGR